jgi:hypothetical protein
LKRCRRSLAPAPTPQHDGGQPIGLAFWINGLLSDWDPTYDVYDNATNTTTTYSRSLHPCTDRAELAAIGAPSGINTTAGGVAPSVRARRLPQRPSCRDGRGTAKRAGTKATAEKPL